ncbi:Rab geranylgeranyltransferase [Peltigera leucophlebia]|nr:Rab geranylgeranyltransferase [Peltigera leucophlebia]
MASHGVPRGSGLKPTSEQARKKELRKIEEYKSLVEQVNNEVCEEHFTFEVLELTSKLLTLNPEFYTIWNYRRLILQHQLNQQLSPDNEAQSHCELILNDLNFLIPLLRKYPKCYWIWKYRLWLLEEASNRLPRADSHRFWQQELGLVGKMLSLDSRNFHGWGYRRVVISALESSQSNLNEAVLIFTEDEFKYATRMIESNLSNFSAWHIRSKLIPRLLNERQASNVEREAFLEKELELIQRALYTDPYDQSLWFYHQYLMCSFDPKYSSQVIVPNLTSDQRLEFLGKEIEKLLEMLDGAEDCKWIYQSLIQLSRIHNAQSHRWPAQENQIRAWFMELKKLDPLRSGRWNDIEQQLSFDA